MSIRLLVLLLLLVVLEDDGDDSVVMGLVVVVVVSALLGAVDVVGATTEDTVGSIVDCRKVVVLLVDKDGRCRVCL